LQRALDAYRFAEDVRLRSKPCAAAMIFSRSAINGLARRHDKQNLLCRCLVALANVIIHFLEIRLVRFSAATAVRALYVSHLSISVV